MKAIVCVDQNWGIGYRGELLFHIPEDMKMFRERTTGQIVIMGRKTLESLPGGRPLPDRVNIVMTRAKKLPAESTGDAEAQDASAKMIAVHSAAELTEALALYPEKEQYVIGGGEIYRLLLPLCDTAYVTVVNGIRSADTFFPDLDADPAWERTEMICSLQDTSDGKPADAAVKAQDAPSWEMRVYRRKRV